MVFKKKDFIEIEFTARVKNGDIFDSNIKQDLKKADLDIEPKPFIFSLGEGMFLKGIEDFLTGKDVGKYEIELPPEKAFGARDGKLIKIVPSNVFKQRKLAPFPGAMFNFDGRMAKVLSVSGGRITVDFNNPVAGKTVIYNINVLRKVNDINEKTKAFIDFLFRKDFKFKIDNKKLILEAEKNLVNIVEAFKDKFKEILGLELEIKEIGEKVKEKKE
ncbi:MAG: peptidylprolyl isomerase [Nanoarchaeota archaeon]|nr:peptidylprolyl isomerase [Nanoarchaeota archaeon]